MGSAGYRTQGNPAEDIIQAIVNEEEPNVRFLSRQDPQTSWGSVRRRYPTPGEAWRVKNLLSLDGGGIRGLWSLLTLRMLMEFIRDEEERLERHEHAESFGPCSSFFPHRFDSNIASEPAERDGARQSLGFHCPTAIAASRRYLPCHYFDYICGSSTGALIALMLGRFRMNVEECINEYYTLGDKIFGKPRHLTTLNIGFVNRSKYKTSRLEDVYQEFCQSRETSNNTSGRILLPSDEDLCRTFVTTLRRHKDREGEEACFLRSYDQKLVPRRWPHVENEGGPSFSLASRQGTGLTTATTQFTDTNSSVSPNVSQTATQGLQRSPTDLVNAQIETSQNGEAQPQSGLSRRTTEMAPRIAPTLGNTIKRTKRNINHGPADTIDVWKVARAATAADLHFDPFVEGNEVYTDGAFGPNINPTHQGILEIEEKYGIASVSIVVSVGTARRPENYKEGIFNWFRRVVNRLTDPEPIHDRVAADLAVNERKGPKYFRLNEPGALGIELDDWRPRKSRFRKGQKKKGKRPGDETVAEIERKWNEWAVQESNRRYLQACAEVLVGCRRVRMEDRAKWERFALGAEFTCPEDGCARTFHNRDVFKRHLESEHGRAFPPTQAGGFDELNQYREIWGYRRRN